jgi:hypothetical protein
MSYIILPNCIYDININGSERNRANYCYLKGSQQRLFLARASMTLLSFAFISKGRM